MLKYNYFCNTYFHNFKMIKHILKLFFLIQIILLISCTKDSSNNLDNSTGSSNLKDSTILNVSYGIDSQQTFDIYLPAKRDLNTPIIISLHGGAWKAGDKKEMNYYNNLILSKWKNVAIVNLNYRLASNAKKIHHNEIIEDIDSVVKFVISNNSKYYISSKIGIMGTSAGGHLSMIYAYKYNNNIKCVGNFFGPSIINDWTWYNSFNIWLGGYVGDIITEYAGQKWDTTAYKAVSPYWNVSSTSQPTIIFHGNLDPIVPLNHSKWHYAKLKTLGVKTEYYEYIATHGFDNTQSADAINKLIAFFKIYLK